ncbi:MAG TPA: DUF5652 family protein [Candidatus Paceibacterota bacterium]|nr:DUF5652 family protein [Candidatus Paceibacterota bacterium]
MNNLNNMPYALGLGAPLWIPAAGLMLLVLVCWSVFWKGLGLWHAAQRGHVGWFFFILILNTAGILEIIYLFFIIKVGASGLFKNHHRKQ